ncbi:tetratricopeptide repeat protein [Hymenobacter weizhouensis]|uniref:tetratricopeptide repeat protein n=1 Tax=Hymenobacter sp. YIM 151500-1 TaxID=2987689 RepID=UPI0022267A82|nr:tetratricopeptide repeat protein [Hymenobacter sp. YIM 151500-1]UYZ64500.1 tetratricopeptide repeat protein [Hymenobacter sp. YIM 151500-1]
MNHLVLRVLPGVGLVLLAACSPLKKVLRQAQTGQEVTVQPAVLESNGESVVFEVTAKVPAAHLRKGTAYSLGLRYRYNNGLGEDTVGRLTFVSGEYVYDEQRKDKLLIRKQFSFPYTTRKSPGELVALPDVHELRPKGKRVKGAEIKLARGIVTTSRLVVRQDTALVLLPEAADNNMSGTRVLPFFFDAGKAEIRNYLGTNVAALEDFIEANQRTEKVMIVAGHSPDSLDRHDPRLADKRVRVLLNYFKNRVDLHTYLNKVSDIDFETEAYHRRWDLFLNKVQASALKPAQIDSVLLLINDTPGTYAQKEKSLHRLSFYDYLDEYIYPVLRFGTVAVRYTAPKRYDSEIYLLSKKIVEKQMEADALTPEELRYSATLTPLLAEKQRIYETAVATTGLWPAYYNLAVVLTQRADKEVNEKVRRAYLRRAAVNFTLAAHRNPTAELFYRVAAAYHRAGDKLEALQNYDYAIKLGGPRPVLSKIFADKAALEIEIGQLDDALRSLGFSSRTYQNLMNRALILVLKGDYPGAATLYQEALGLRPQDPLLHYCLAVVAARQQNEPAVALHLRHAVELDRTYATRAVEDLEFRDFAKGKPFLEALR